jgi:hypothetical protein
MLVEERQARQGKQDGDDKAEAVCEDREREPDERCGDAEPSPRRLARHAWHENITHKPQGISRVRFSLRH